MTCRRSACLAAPPGGDRGQAAAPRRAALRDMLGRKASSARVSRMPEPSALTSDTEPWRSASARPGVPICECGLQFERIGEGGVHAPPQHADRLQAGDGAHHQPAVGDGQVLAFEQHDAEIAGDIGVLVIGLVERAGRQDGDAARRRVGHAVSAHRGSGGRSRPAGGRASRHRCRTARASWRRGFPARSRRPTAPACGRPAPTIRRSGRGRVRRRRNAGNVRSAGFTPTIGRRIFRARRDQAGRQQAVARPAGSRHRCRRQIASNSSARWISPALIACPFAPRRSAAAHAPAAIRARWRRRLS